MNQKRWLCGALCAGLLLPLLAGAEALLKPIPTPDASKLPAEQAKQLASDRAEFEKTRADLIGPPLAQAYAQMGALYARAGFKEAAAVALYDATQADPEDARWFYLRGVLARDLKQNADARANFQASLALDRVYVPISYRLSDTLIVMGDLDGAHKVLADAAKEHPDQAAAFAMLGQLDLRQKRYSDAVTNLSAALKIEPQANQLYKPLAEAYAALGNAAAAKEAEAKVGDVTPSIADPLAVGLYSSGGPRPSGTPLQQAEQLVSAGRVAAARQKLAEVLSEHPDDVDALALQARLEASVGDQLIAEAAADQALKDAPNNATALLARGVVHEYGGADDKAYGYYQRAVRADGTLGAARLLLGNAEMRRGRYGPAADQYQQLVALQTADVQARSHLVAAQVAQGQCVRALADVSAAQSRDPRNGDLMQLFVRLASTCPAAKKEERDRALDYAQTLYKQRPDAGDSSALALALAAHGQFKDAQQYQAEAIFEAVRDGDKSAAELYRSTQASFAANKVPDRPWPAEHAYFRPPLLTPIRPVAPAQAPAKQ